MTRAWLLILCVALPAQSLAQTATMSPPPPPPPSYPPAYPPPTDPVPSYPPGVMPAPPLVTPPPAPYSEPQPNLRPYAPLTPNRPLREKTEYPLEAAELAASIAVAAASTVGVYLIAANPTYAAAQDLILLLFVATVPIFSALPVWGISLLSDTYDMRFWPVVEAGSTVAGIALLLGFIGILVNSNPLIYTAGAALIVGMPLAEVIAGHVTKLPKGMGFNFYGSATKPPWDFPVASEWLSIPAASRLMMFSTPAVTF